MNTVEQKTEMDQKVAKVGIGVRGVAVTAILLAVGTILHLISPSLGGITPNWTIAMYCIAINLVRPTLQQALGIGAVAGALNIPTSKSAFPYGNMVSEPLGAFICACIVHLQTEFFLGKFSLKPGISAGIATIFSGAAFITILKFVLSLPMHVYLYAMWPVVLSVAAINAIVTQALFPVASRIFIRREHKNG